MMEGHEVKMSEAVELAPILDVEALLGAIALGHRSTIDAVNRCNEALERARWMEQRYDDLKERYDLLKEERDLLQAALDG